VTDCVAAVFTETLPNDSVVALTPRVGTDAESDSVNVFELLEVEAVNVTVCAVLTAAAVAVKPAPLVPAAICTDGGTVTAALLLVRLTLMPPDGAFPLMVTVHVSVAAPVSELALQVNDDTVGKIVMVPVPLSATVMVPPVLALLVMTRLPDTAPVVVGSNCTVTTAV
jgi:hypothetical protein